MGLRAQKYPKSIWKKLEVEISLIDFALTFKLLSSQWAKNLFLHKFEQY
jgi:hypothetical protein